MNNTRVEIDGPMLDLMVELKDVIDRAIDKNNIQVGDALCSIGNVVAYVIKDTDANETTMKCMEFLVEVALHRLMHDRSLYHMGTGTVN